MGDLALGAATAFWLGVLTSISPCPLATNIAAVSFLGRELERPRRVFLGGLLYALGRAAAYVALSALVVAGLLSIPSASRFLQQYMNRLLGPVLIVVGLFLLEVVRLNLPGLGRVVEKLQGKLESRGVVGAFFLGALFAVSFCPISAALFFGSLMPLALDVESPVLLPTAYGAGTALPVVGFAVLIAMGARVVADWFNRLTTVERWARRITAVVFLGVGIYMTLVYTVGLSIWPG